MNKRKRIALVTGGGTGIGLGISQALAAEGHDLAIAGRRPASAIDEQLEALRALGTQVLYLRGDIAVAAERDAMLAEVEQTFGALHVLVNNAGVAPAVRADMLEATEESYELVMRINLQGPYFLTQAAARWMIRQRQADPAYRACIIYISSVSATMASPNRGEYCLSKAGVAMASRLWAVRLAEYDIPVYEIRPGIVRTEMTAGVTEKYDRLLEQGLCLQNRWGEPSDIGRAAAMLTRGDLPYATGQVLHIDGGMTIPTL